MFCFVLFFQYLFLFSSCFFTCYLHIYSVCGERFCVCQSRCVSRCVSVGGCVGASNLPSFLPLLTYLLSLSLSLISFDILFIFFLFRQVFVVLCFCFFFTEIIRHGYVANSNWHVGWWRQLICWVLYCNDSCNNVFCIFQYRYTS